jgi:hypothetical protein
MPLRMGMQCCEHSAIHSNASFTANGVAAVQVQLWATMVRPSPSGACHKNPYIL